MSYEEYGGRPTPAESSPDLEYLELDGNRGSDSLQSGS